MSFGRSLPALVVISLIMSTSVPVGAAAPPVLTGEQRYRACMDRVATNAQAALDEARAWQKQGGGHPAGHCAAAAMMQLGQVQAAAQALQALADDPNERDRSLRASLFAQAAHAWLSADEPEKAQAAAQRGLDIVNDQPDLLVLHARALAEQRRFSDAVSDLNRAIDVWTADTAAVSTSVALADAYVFRASALRQMRAVDAAAADLKRALAIVPNHPEGLLELGIVNALQGDREGAKKAWMATIAADPKTPAAEEARINLDRIAQEK